MPRTIWVLFAATFINRFGMFVLPFLVIYLTREGYSAAQAGVAISAYGAGHLIASMLGGHLADRIGRRYTIVLSMCASAAAMIALSQAHAYPAILVITLLAGAAAEMYRPAAGALIGDVVAPEQRVTAFAIHRLAHNLDLPRDRRPPDFSPITRSSCSLRAMPRRRCCAASLR